MRMLAVVTCVVLAGASQAMALPGLLGTSFSQSYSTASGLSKITFKRTASRGSLDAQVFIAELDPCGRALGLGGPGLEVDITNSLGLYGLTLAPPSALWATKCTIDLPGTDGAGTDSGSLDTGQCKIRFKVTVDASFLVTHASVSAKCSLPIPVATTSAAYLQFVNDFGSGLQFYPMCFLSSGPGAAEVVKDGSDGKHVKMKNAPQCS